MWQRVTSAPVAIVARVLFRRTSIACLCCLLFFSQSWRVAAEASPSDISETALWPLMQGESVGQLAAKFYPNNPSMQEVFINQTIALNQSLHAQLSANTSFGEITHIIVPDLKALSQQSSKHRPISSVLQTTQPVHELNSAIVTESMKRQYQALETQHVLLGKVLESFFLRLDQLQANFKKINAVVQSYLNKHDPAPQAKAPIQLAQANVQTPIQEAIGNDKDAPWYAPISTSVLIGLVLLIAAFLYGSSKRRDKHLIETPGTQTISPIEWPDTEVKPSLNAESSEVKTPSVSESLAQAKILVASGKPKAAAERLVAVVAAKPDDSLEAWLYLLDLYRDMGLKTEFVEYAQRLHTSFNVVTPQWEIKEVALVMANSLEEFPHIIEALSQHWKDGSAQAYLTGLLKDNREGERAGFSIPVLQEIMLLQAILKIRE
jgi:hypothetical protein